MNKFVFNKISIVSFITLCMIAFFIIQKPSKIHAPVQDAKKIQNCFENDPEIIHEIATLLKQLNGDYQQYETNNPQHGYCVMIQANPHLVGKIIPHGGKRNTEKLSGIPESESEYKKICPFCNLNINDNVNSNILHDFKDGTYAIKSFSNQILVIPTQHYAHFFTMPEQLQMTILKNSWFMQSNYLLTQYNYAIKKQRSIEFHCGSAAEQTVFHTHGRTGIYLK